MKHREGLLKQKPKYWSHISQSALSTNMYSFKVLWFISKTPIV